MLAELSWGVTARADAPGGMLASWTRPVGMRCRRRQRRWRPSPPKERSHTYARTGKAKPPNLSYLRTPATSELA